MYVSVSRNGKNNNTQPKDLFVFFNIINSFGTFKIFLSVSRCRTVIRGGDHKWMVYTLRFVVILTKIVLLENFSFFLAILSQFFQYNI